MTIFWLLSLYTLSRCVASPDDRITLNFSSVDTPKVSVFEGFDNGFAFESYTVHKGFGISSIVNGQEEVWRASPGEKAVLAVWYKYDGLPLVAVDVRKGGVSTTQCYEKNGKEWKGVTEEDADKTFRKIRMQNSGYDLDIYSPNMYKTAVDEEEKDDGSVHHMYTPEEGVEILSVSDRGATVWTADNYQKCIYAKVITGGRSELMQLQILRPKTEEYFERKPGSGWKSISKDVFYKKIAEKQDTPKPTTPCNLDLAKPDKKRIVQSARKCAGFKCGAYSAVEGFRVTSVSDGKIPIWKAKDSQKCTLVTFYIAKGSKFATIYISDANESTQVRFEKKGGEWKETTGKGCFNLLDEISGSETESSCLKETTALDISNPNTNFLDVTRNISGKLISTAYTPKQSVFISAVADHNHTLWKPTSSNVRLIYVRRASCDNLDLISIFAKYRFTPCFVFFEKDGKRWKEIQSEEYNRKLEIIKARKASG
ncbi:signal peptide containing protein [Theileria equi strain WA]|uniref:Signal peptide containing protein n=1 Tax=Theileria equi strain WA TaxID=1537102 RepID=L1LFD4_THEEQ|nr:signal peptide containing protein [Theileria equi strain WA]EKX74147.1 signal peptide containing protein [Theileria equi strain WA]|eukprot:XP_004833599.1 signal peptide containing protein [Theileria equi strain WA]